MPPRKSSLPFLISALCALALAGCALTQSSQPFFTAAEAFLQALGEADYAAAFSMLTPEARQAAGGVGGLQGRIEAGQLQPGEWSLTSVQLTTSGPQRDQAVEMAGSVTFHDGAEGFVFLSLVKTGELWEIKRFDLSR